MNIIKWNCGLKSHLWSCDFAVVRFCNHAFDFSPNHTFDFSPNSVQSPLIINLPSCLLFIAESGEYYPVVNLATRQISSHGLRVILKLTIIRSASIPHCVNWFSVGRILNRVLKTRHF
jgi:hypothetical protein